MTSLVHWPVYQAVCHWSQLQLGKNWLLGWIKIVTGKLLWHLWRDERSCPLKGTGIKNQSTGSLCCFLPEFCMLYLYVFLCYDSCVKLFWNSLHDVISILFSLVLFPNHGSIETIKNKWINWSVKWSFCLERQNLFKLAVTTNWWIWNFDCNITVASWIWDWSWVQVLYDESCFMRQKCIDECRRRIRYACHSEQCTSLMWKWWTSKTS